MSLDTTLLDDSTIETNIKEFSFPLSFEFKIGTFSNDFIVREDTGGTVAYVRQKMFKFKEAIQVFSNEQRAKVVYTIDADRIIDFNASYSFKNEEEELLGKVGRKGMRSLWKASYEIFDNESSILFHIKEENPWAKIFDSLLGEVPVLSFFTGYLFNPKYIVSKTKNTPPVLRLSKEPSFFGRKFKLEKLSDISHQESEQIILSLMMMTLLERRRG